MRIPRTPPLFAALVDELDGRDNTLRVLEQAKPLDYRGRYLHWDDMRNRTPPDGLDHGQWWLATRLARRAMARPLPLRATDGSWVTFCNVDPVQEMVHRIDQQASGQTLASDVVTNLRSSDRYLVSSLVEEAITSSQLEGASTTRRVAKELLASGREPRDRSERMIVNNFQAMTYAQEIAARPLTPTDVLDLHRIVAEDAIDDLVDAGRIRPTDDKRVGVYWHDNTLLHQPPPGEELPERLEAMCRFANGDEPDGFLHPVVRAVVLHYWLAYDHPFSDGNGRTARALFYWAMLRSGYWLTRYLSVSSILRKAPVQYARSFLLTETDGDDVTYFVMYQLKIIQRAIDSLHQYLARKIEATREVEALLHGTARLNHRQLVVVGDALRDPSQSFTIAAQAGRHRVTYESARSDLLRLEQLGFLEKRRVGKKFVYHSVPDLVERVRRIGA